MPLSASSIISSTYLFTYFSFIPKKSVMDIKINVKMHLNFQEVKPTQDPFLAQHV